MFFLFNSLGEFAIIGIIAFILIGALECFFGYKLFKFQITLTGATIGFYLTGFITELLTKDIQIAIFSAVLGAILCGFIMFKLHLFGVFVCVFSMVASSVVLALWTFNIDAFIIALASSFLGLLIAIISVLLTRPLVIVLTSTIGAYILSFALSSFVIGTSISTFESFTIVTILTLAFFVLGTIIQFKTNRNLLVDIAVASNSDTSSQAEPQFEEISFAPSDASQTTKPSTDIDKPEPDAIPEPDVAPEPQPTQHQKPHVFQTPPPPAFCKFCGFKIAPNSHFCGKCGSRIQY